MKKFWKNTPSEYKDYLFIYLWGGIWAIVCLINPLILSEELLVVSMVSSRFWSGVALVGATLAVVGLIKRDNLILERAGVSLLMVGPASYAATMAGELVVRSLGGAHFSGISDWRVLALMVFALWPYLFLNKRRRHLRGRVRLVAKIPLSSEDVGK